MHNDLIHTYPERFGGNLAKNSVAALPNIGRARHYIERAIFIELDRSATKFKAGDATSLHRRCHTPPSPDGFTISAIKWSVPANCCCTAFQAFWQAAGTELAF